MALTFEFLVVQIWVIESDRKLNASVRRHITSVSFYLIYSNMSAIHNKKLTFS